MDNSEKILRVAKHTLNSEGKAILALESTLSDSFVDAVNAIYKTEGRVVVTGIGKSALIGQKMVATFNSTGTSSIFMHAADAVHGDLGMIGKSDVVLCLSKSGETQELKVLVPLLKDFGNPIIAVVSNEQSYLARHADYFLYAPVDEEADPNDLAPTTSSTLHLALGDALAMSLIELRSFTSSQFAKIHPGGSLGKQLYLRVRDVGVLDDPPLVDVNDSIRRTIIEMTSKRLGVTAVEENEQLVGIITDGDLRRMLERDQDADQFTARDIMSKDPYTISSSAFAVDALSAMKDKSISQILIVDEGVYKGVLHIHDLIKEGIV